MHAAAGAFYSAYHARLQDVRRAAHDACTGAAPRAHAVDALIDARRELRAAPPLPPRDVLQYESELRAIQRILAESARPGRVFRFAREHVPACSDMHATHEPPAAAAHAPADSGLTLRGRVGHVVLGELPALYVCDVHDAHIEATVRGSILVDGCTHTRITAACGQFRMSASAHMALAVRTPSAITLDACTHVAVYSDAAVQDFSDVHGVRGNWTRITDAARGAPAP